MRIAVIGAGPVGLTAAYRLGQASHDVEMIEALPMVGGRTHAEHFGPGHHCDTGAGWLAWMRALQGGAFYQVAGGMDTPWLRLAERLTVRVSERVEAVHATGGGVEVVAAGGMRRYDGAVLAVPAPVAARMVGDDIGDLPEWLGQVRYAPEARAYAARWSAEDAQFGVHVVPAATIGTVELSSGRHVAWGTCPPDWQRALVSAHGAASGALLDAPADEVTRMLWSAGQEIAPAMFGLEDAEVVSLMRWRWAVPIMELGHYTRLASYRRMRPVVLAGDWTHQACIEGAVRSGEAAAAVFGPA